MLKCLCFVSLIFTINTAIAQSEKIQTDRLGETRTADIVPKKWLQFENGFLYQRDKFDGDLIDKYFQLPSLFLRYGLANRFELRFATGLATVKDYAVNGNAINTGLISTQFGGKLNILEEKKIRPKISLIAQYEYRRIKNLYLRPDTVDGANFRFAMRNTISEKFSINYNVGMQWRRFGSNPAFIYTFAPHFYINEKWFAFAEAYGYIWNDRSPENSIDAGVNFKINNNFTVDASAGFGISKQAPTNFFSIGTCFRFKTSNKE